jgi:hypothetical protein
VCFWEKRGLQALGTLALLANHEARGMHWELHCTAGAGCPWRCLVTVTMGNGSDVGWRLRDTCLDLADKVGTGLG